jgi:hypothetical protein
MGLAFGGQGGLRLFRRGHLLAELSQARLAGRRICRGAQQQQCQVEAGKAVSHTADTGADFADFVTEAVNLVPEFGLAHAYPSKFVARSKPSGFIPGQARPRLRSRVPGNPVHAAAWSRSMTDATRAAM